MHVQSTHRRYIFNFHIKKQKHRVRGLVKQVRMWRVLIRKYRHGVKQTTELLECGETQYPVEKMLIARGGNSVLDCTVAGRVWGRLYCRKIYFMSTSGSSCYKGSLFLRFRSHAPIKPTTEKYLGLWPISVQTPVFKMSFRINLPRKPSTFPAVHWH